MFVDDDESDAGGFGLIAQGAHEVGAPPLPQPEVLAPPHLAVGDAGKVADREGADPMRDRPGDERLGGLMVGETDPTLVPGFGPAPCRAQLAPTLRAFLAAAGSLPAHASGAGFGVGEVQAFLGSDGPPRHHQRLVVAGGGKRVDDPDVDACDPSGFQAVLGDRNRRGHV